MPHVPEDAFTRTILIITTALVIAGVGGVWNMSMNVAQIDAKLGVWMTSVDKRIGELNARDAEFERRLSDYATQKGR